MIESIDTGAPDSAKRKRRRPKPWWFYRDQKRKQQKKLEQAAAAQVSDPGAIPAPEVKKKKRNRNSRRRRAARKRQENNASGDAFASSSTSRSSSPIFFAEQPNSSSNLPKADTLLYRDDADIKVVDVEGHVPLRCNTWDEMDLDKTLLANMKKCGFIWPRKVQEVVVPYIAEGYDIKCQSETGTGKTASYLIPIIDNLIKQKSREGLPFEGPICLVLAPTREIVEQIYQDARKLAYQTGISVAKAYGEIPVKDNLEQLTKGCNILCACIGRLTNLMEHDHHEWEDLLMLDMRYLVIDEADYFLTGPETQDIQTFLDHERLPPFNERQNLYFSPTLRTQKWELLADKYSNIKKTVLLTSSLECNQRIKFVIEDVPMASDKFKFLLNRVKNIVAENDGKCPRIMIFTNTKKTADTVALDLTNENYPAIMIHSDYSQHRRDKTMAEFRKDESSKCRILVSVNVVGRGIDIPDMDYVINYDVPNSHDSKYRFIQRCGRTGRTRPGTAYTFYVHASDKNMAPGIVEVLENAQQEVPEFLKGHVLTAEIEKSMEKLSMNQKKRQRRRKKKQNESQ